MTCQYRSGHVLLVSSREGLACPADGGPVSDIRDASTTVGAAVRALRNARGWSQPELERRSGVPQRTISRIENATKEGYVPMPHTLRSLAAALGVTVADLLSAAGYDVRERDQAVDLTDPLLSVSLAYADRLTPERKSIVIALIRDLAESDETEA